MRPESSLPCSQELRLNQLNPFLILTSYFFNIGFNIIISSTFIGPFPSGFPTNILYEFL